MNAIAPKVGQQEPATVLLIEGDPSGSSLLSRTLTKNGYRIVGRLTQDEKLVSQVYNYAPDVLVIGIDSPHQTLLDNLAELYRTSPHPIVMFAEQDAPKVIQQAIKAGVNAYVANEIQPRKIQAIMTAAIARFDEHQSLRKELELTKSKLAERKILEKAKGLLMEKQSISEQDAYRQIRRMAMDKGQSLAKVSEDIVAVLELLDAEKST